MISLYDFLMEASQAEKIKYIKTNIDSIDSRPDLVDYIYNKMTLGELTKEQIDKFKKHLDDIGLGKHVNAIMRYFNDVEIREFIEYIDNPDNMVPITHIVDIGGGVRRGNLKKVLDPGNKYSSDLFFDLFNNTEKPNKGPAGSGGNAAVGKCEHMLHFFIRNAKESINNTGDVTADGIHVEVKDNGGRISSNGKSLGNEACAIELKRSLAQYGVDLDDDNPFGGIKVTPKIFDRIYNELKSKDKFCECLVNALNEEFEADTEYTLTATVTDAQVEAELGRIEGELKQKLLDIRQ